MSSLRELQADFRNALLYGVSEDVGAAIIGDASEANARIGVYRNNVFGSLCQVLKDVFPVVCRVVDERFFLYAVNEFIRAYPPEQASLFVFGERFADFLASFPSVRELRYLADLARLEWAMNNASHAADAEPLVPQALADVGEDATPNLVFRFHPSITYLRSPWPIDRIWQANRLDGDCGNVDLDSGAARLEVRRMEDEIVYRIFVPAIYEFRAMLARGATLEAAMDAALAIEPCLDLETAFSDLFRDRSLIGFTLKSSIARERP